MSSQLLAFRVPLHALLLWLVWQKVDFTSEVARVRHTDTPIAPC